MLTWDLHLEDSSVKTLLQVTSFELLESSN